MWENLAEKNVDDTSSETPTLSLEAQQQVILCSMSYQFPLLNARTEGGRTENKIQTHSGLIYTLETRLDGKTGFIKQHS